MISRRRFLVLIGGAAPIAAGVAAGIWLLPGDDSSDGTPGVRWDEDSCEHCGMVISDPRYAAVWIEGDNRQLRFDDIGCMVMNLREHPPAGAARFFARDFAAESWIDAAAAFYVSADVLRSPMAYGIAAFADREAGRAELGDAVTREWTWTELVDGLERKERNDHDEPHAA